MTITVSVLLTILAVVCFVIALLIAIPVGIDNGNFEAWVAGGLALFAAAHLPFRR